MEILNNIWTALTTENKTITDLIAPFAIFFEVYFSFKVSTQILKIPYTSKQRNIYVIGLTVFGVINSLFIPDPFNILLNYFVLFVFVKYILNLNVFKAILAIIIPFVIFGLVNSLLLNPSLKLVNKTFQEASMLPLYRILYLCITYLTVYLILLLIKHINFKIPFNIELDKKNKLTIFISLILGIVTLFIQIILNFYYISNVPIIFTLFNFGLLFAYFFYNFYSFIKTAKLDVATRDLENAESYNNSLTILYDNVRGFKHDFDNIVHNINGYLKVDDIDGLKKYISSFEKDFDNTKNVQLLNPNIINNPGIYNLLVAKYKKASDLDVKINFEFFFDFNNLKMPIYEFSRIFGILLDNAIEAAKECEEKIVNIVFRESGKQHIQIVIVENTYLDKEIDTKNIFEKGISGKEKHSGIGLWEVNQIIKKNNNIVLNTTKDDKFFKQELQIYY